MQGALAPPCTASLIGDRQSIVKFGLADESLSRPRQPLDAILSGASGGARADSWLADCRCGQAQFAEGSIRFQGRSLRVLRDDPIGTSEQRRRVRRRASRRLRITAVPSASLAGNFLVTPGNARRPSLARAAGLWYGRTMQITPQLFTKECRQLEPALGTRDAETLEVLAKLCAGQSTTQEDALALGIAPRLVPLLVLLAAHPQRQARGEEPRHGLNGLGQNVHDIATSARRGLSFFRFQDFLLQNATWRGFDRADTVIVVREFCYLRVGSIAPSIRCRPPARTYCWPSKTRQ